MQIDGSGRVQLVQSVPVRLHNLDVNLLGARNRAIGELVLDCPPLLVADTLGYSYQVAFLHADKAAEPWAHYAGRAGPKRRDFAAPMSRKALAAPVALHSDRARLPAV